MRGFFASILVGLIVLFGFVGVAQAKPLTVLSAVEAAPTDVLEQLKTQVLPQIQAILTPEQQKQLESAIVDGKPSLPKAIKSLALTPDQKAKMAGIFKTLPKQEIFTSMTSEQKQQLFMSKKDLFMPSAEEIAGYKSMKGK
jgi:Spy/CpxP family protein refolding chaperone